MILYIKQPAIDVLHTVATVQSVL